MPQLIVRNLEDEVVNRLKKRAGEHGISTEEEHRRILRTTLLEGNELAAPSFKEHLLALPDVDVDSLFERDRSLGGRASDQNLFEE
jgi:antitoxin FitA